MSAQKCGENDSLTLELKQRVEEMQQRILSGDGLLDTGEGIFTRDSARCEGQSRPTTKNRAAFARPEHAHAADTFGAQGRSLGSSCAARR
jgi:hypothetical protein